MKEKIKKVYYCNYCKKKYFHRDACINHEEHCTLNENRSCRLCKLEKGRLKQVINYLRCNSTDKNGITIDVIKSALMNERKDSIFCPNCVLTIIRVLELQHLYDDFNYKKETNKFFGEFFIHKPKSTKTITTEELKNEIKKYVKNEI